jgi:hypothetical protein
MELVFLLVSSLASFALSEFFSAAISQRAAQRLLQPHLECSALLRKANPNPQHSDKPI